MGDFKIATGAFLNSRLGVLDSLNNIVETSFPYPFEYEEIQGIHRGSVFQSKIGSNISQNKFVIMTMCSDIFEIYEIRGDIIENIFTGFGNEIPKIIEKPRGDLKYAIDYDNSTAGLLRMSVTEQKIYFTYSAESYSQSANSGKESNELLCYDWNGNKVQKYILPFKISNFCVNNEWLYAVTNSASGTVIMKYKIDNKG